MKKIGRNQACPCGSGKKYKKCCNQSANKHHEIKPTEKEIGALKAKHLIKVRQQGQGRPIISTLSNNSQTVTVGNKLYSSPHWKTFVDFLSQYIQKIMGKDWGNLELKKPFEEHHIILKWYNKYCEQTNKYIFKCNDNDNYNGNDNNLIII